VCKLRHTTIANPQFSISCASFLPIIVSYAPAFSIEARQDVGAWGEAYIEPPFNCKSPSAVRPENNSVKYAIVTAGALGLGIVNAPIPEKKPRKSRPKRKKAATARPPG
jgi:hypothetical protein